MGGSRRYCGHCGQEVKQGAQYCATCGHAVAANTTQASHGAQAAGAGEADAVTRTLNAPAPRPAPPWDQPAYGPGGAVYPPDDPPYPPGQPGQPGEPGEPGGVRPGPGGSARPASGAAHPRPGASYSPAAEDYPLAETYPPPAGAYRPPGAFPPADSTRPASADAAFQQLADAGNRPADDVYPPPPADAYPPPPAGSPHPPEEPPHPPPAGPGYPPPAGPAYPLPAESAFPPPAGPAYPLPADSGYPPGAAPPPPGSAGTPSATDTAQFPPNWLDDVGPNPRWEQQPRLPLDPVGPDRRNLGQRRRMLIIGMVSLLALVIVVPAVLILNAFHGFSGGSKTSPPAAAKSPPGTARVSAQQAARNLAGLLAQSVTDRRSVELAVSDVNHCGPALDQDPQAFRAHAGSRQRLLRQLASLPGRSVLPASMIRELTSAWQASMTVDSDLAQWAQDEATHGCKKNDHHDPNLAAASAPNNEATAAKAAFVEMWNPIAGKYGLTPYRTSQL